MPDVFTTTSNTGFFSRMKNAIAGTFLGLILVPASVLLLGWNEYRTIHRTHALNEGASVVESVADPAVASPELCGKLIHLNGKADTQERLRDEQFGIEENAIRLTRNVEMFQWVETKSTRKKNGKKTTKYEYKQDWDSGRNNHADFEYPEGHQNPVAKFSDSTVAANEVNLGGYLLNSSLKNSVRSDEMLEWKDEIVQALPADIRDHSLISGSYLYWSREGLPSSESPKLGDHRISVNVVRPANVSLVAGVKDASPNQLKPWGTSNGEELQKLYMGDFSAAEVFAKMQDENNMWAWIFRGLGLFVSFIGFTMIMGVLSAFTERIPLVGSMTRSIIGFVAFMLAIVLTAMTIAVSWVAVRPLVAIPLMLVAVGAAVLAWRSSRSKSQPENPYAQAAPAAAGDTPVMLGSDDVIQQ